MTNPVLFVWALVWTVCSGALIVAALMVPEAQPNLGRWILAAISVAAVVAVPVSRSVGNALRS